MIQKGMITQEEAKKVRAEADSMRTNAPTLSSSSKWKISEGIKRLELSATSGCAMRTAKRPIHTTARSNSSASAMRSGSGCGETLSTITTSACGLKQDSMGARLG